MRLISFALIGAFAMVAAACNDRPAPEASAPEAPMLATQFAEKLALHAQAEEEVNYPAAVLVGDVIRSGRQRGR